MTISELIHELEVIRALHGDLPIIIREPAFGVSGVIVTKRPVATVMLALEDDPPKK